MAISTLNRAQAFGGGCDLWIVPDKKKFTFFSKLDWYLNFQLTRAQLHTSQSLSPQLKNITNDNNLPDFSATLKKLSPLMVSAEFGLPTKTVIEIPFAGTGTSWAENIHQTWMSLDRPLLRVFLPSDLSPDEFKKIWPGSKSEDVSVVPA